MSPANFYYKHCKLCSNIVRDKRLPSGWSRASLSRTFVEHPLSESIVSIDFTGQVSEDPRSHSKVLESLLQQALE
ncbi:MAG: hypothetical protein CMJ81_18660 [Planctomycetaceae bacterium]|nr:hypothetical protein [Planctomycetaceae bacterium]MBP62724.1 hypothetical protein [Planctomycetaceae bacterium]